MRRPTPATWLLVLPLILSAWPSIRPAQPQAIVLDGVLDASGYTLLAQDPSGDIAKPFTASSATAWSDLTTLHVATDTTNLYVFAALPDYNLNTSTGEIGLAIDITGDIPDSGGAADPNNNPITYAYTSTLNNISTTAQSTAHTLLPDVVIRGNLVGHFFESDPNDGITRLRKWTGSEWSGASENWGGITDTPIGTHIAYASGGGVELAIPFADLAVPPTSTIHLQFYVTRRNTVEGHYGAIDTIPPDDQSATEYNATIQRHLATWPPPAPPLPPPPPPPPPPGPCDSATLGDGAVVTTTLHHLDTDPAYRSPTGVLTATQPVTLSLRACAADLTSVAVLVWNPTDSLASPAHAYTLTATAATPPYTNWRVIVPPLLPAVDRQYQFQLTDALNQSYFHPAQGLTGPGAWSPTRSTNRWQLALEAQPPPPPPPPPPEDWFIHLPSLLR